MIIVGKASQKLTASGYLKNDAKDIRSSALQDNVSTLLCFLHINTHKYNQTVIVLTMKLYYTRRAQLVKYPHACVRKCSMYINIYQNC